MVVTTMEVCGISPGSVSPLRRVVTWTTQGGGENFLREGGQSAGSLHIRYQAQMLPPRGPVAKGQKSGSVTVIHQGPLVNSTDGAQTQMAREARLHGHLPYLSPLRHLHSPISEPSVEEGLTSLLTPLKETTVQVL